MHVEHIIFDLDGTLIDSSRGVLESFRIAFERFGIQPLLPLTSELIGPPLMDTLARLSGTTDESLLDRLASAFKAHYDGDGYRLTRAFPGVDAMLRALAASGTPLSIATNKRASPSRKILDHLQWTNHFSALHALDSFSPPLKRKAEMLARIAATRGMKPSRSLYVGDRQEDGEAAQESGFLFLRAKWGYGSPEEKSGWRPRWRLASLPGDVVSYLDDEK